MQEQVTPASGCEPSASKSSSFDSAHRRKVLLLSVGLLLAVIWTFAPAFNNDFVSLDDPDYVTANIHVRNGLTAENIGWAFRSIEASNWHPVTWISHMADCHFFGLKASWHHLTNVLLHAANSLLVFLVFHRMTGAVWRSFFVAVVFGLHPLRVESVAWVAERKDVLSTLFWLLTMWAYVRYAEERGTRGEEIRDWGQNPNSRSHAPRYYALTLLFFILGLMSKPMLVTLPCVLLLLDYWPLNRLNRKNVWRLVLEKAPFFLATGVVSGITMIAQKTAGAVRTDLSLIMRLENALVSYARYLGKLFYPVNLTVFYPHPRHWPLETLLASAVLLVGISIVVLKMGRRFRYLPVGFFWFLGTLVPTIGLVQVGVQSLADRYTYVPLIGLVAGLIWSVYDLTRRWRYQAISLSAAGVASVLFCLALTLQQISYWKDSKTLFQHAILARKDNYMAHYYMGTTLEKEGRLDDAITEFEEALRLRPNVDVCNGFGIFLEKHGRLDEAIVQFERAVNLDPLFAEPHYYLASALYRKGRWLEAIEQFEQTLKLEPNYPNAHNELGIALGRMGRWDEALAEFQQALNLKPDSPDVRYNIGNALLRKGRLDEAIAQFQQALVLKQDAPDVHNNLAIALTRKGRVEEAISHLQEALRIKPDYPEAQKNLAAALAFKEAQKNSKPAP